MRVPTLFKTGPDKIKATIANIERDLKRTAEKIDAESHAITELALAAYEGDPASKKRHDEACARRDRFQDERGSLQTVLAAARLKLAQAEAELDLAGRQAKQKRLRELLDRRMELARQVWETMQRLLTLMREMMADVPEINALLGDLMNRTVQTRGLEWRLILAGDKTEQRLAEASQAMGLTEVFPTYGVASGRCDQRPFPDVEQEACDRAYGWIAYSEEVARKAAADEDRERRRKAAERATAEAAAADRNDVYEGDDKAA